MATPPNDYYMLLQVDRDADQQTLANSYLKLVREYEVGAGERLSQIAKAYQVLSSPSKRAAYDQGNTEENTQHIIFGRARPNSLATSVVNYPSSSSTMPYSDTNPWAEFLKWVQAQTAISEQRVAESRSYAEELFKGSYTQLQEGARILDSELNHRRQAFQDSPVIRDWLDTINLRLVDAKKKAEEELAATYQKLTANENKLVDALKQGASETAVVEQQLEEAKTAFQQQTESFMALGREHVAAFDEVHNKTMALWRHGAKEELEAFHSCRRGSVRDPRYGKVYVRRNKERLNVGQ